MNTDQNAASSEKDLRNTDLNDRSEATNGADAGYPNQLNNKSGFGSPYGGTQSANSKVPDGNQTPSATESTPNSGDQEAGEEYKDGSSYGEAQGGGKEGENAGTDAGGSPIR